MPAQDTLKSQHHQIEFNTIQLRQEDLEKAAL